MIAGVLELSWRDIRELRVTDPYSVHRVIYSLFPDERTPEKRMRISRLVFYTRTKVETRFPDAFCFSQTENPWHRYTARYELGAFQTHSCSTRCTRSKLSSILQRGERMAILFPLSKGKTFGSGLNLGQHRGASSVCKPKF